MLGKAILLVIAAMLVIAASVAEVAVFALPYPRVLELASAGRRGSRLLKALRERPAWLLATLWTVRVAGAALAAFAAWSGAAVLGGGAWLTTLLAVTVAVIVMVFAEVLGKALGQHCGERPALLIAPPLWLLTRPLTLLTWPAEIIARVFAPEYVEVLPGISDREIRDLVGQGNGEAVIEEHERLLIERAFQLDQTTAYDVMTPRVDMVAWPEEGTLAGIAPALRAVRYSRIPLYSGSIDKITGVLYTRDAFQALISGQRDVPLRALAREPFFVPGSLTLDKLLLDFQTRRIHLGIVIDEYGAVDGLIALEDILEELVGEIVDESDIAEESIHRLGRSEILVAGSADLREINHFFNTTFPLLEHRSLNGYLLDVLGRVPQPGEQITEEGVVIEVTEATDTQVLRARLKRSAPGTAQITNTPPAAADPAAEGQTGTGSQ
ncbi:MAG TPA: hemolysin family protein [Gemmatimonadota bacterium]|nr:hemolysin family protein [Gemmatimonadota bacterium]